MSVHAAIHGFTAPGSDRAVLLFRRSKRETWMLTLRGTQALALDAGSAFTGFFEPDLCDLSPDGVYFVYYAIGRDTRHFDTRYKYWTAICKPPYVRAHVFLPHHARDGGGGVMGADGAVTLDPGARPAIRPEDVVAPRRLSLAFGPLQGPRSCDRGWMRDGDAARREWGKWTLHRRATAASRKDGFSGGEYSLESEAGTIIPLDGVTWADIKPPGHLVVADGAILTVYAGTQAFEQKRGARFDLVEAVAAKGE